MSIRPLQLNYSIYFADGYSDNQCVIQLASGGKCISKMRILYKASTTEGPIIEVLTRADGENSYFFAYSCGIGFTFQDPVEVSETPDSGYSVKEFAFLKESGYGRFFLYHIILPVKSSKDMEKINTKDYNGVLETTEVFSKVKAVDTSGNDILVLPDLLPPKEDAVRSVQVRG